MIQNYSFYDFFIHMCFTVSCSHCSASTDSCKHSVLPRHFTFIHKKVSQTGSFLARAFGEIPRMCGAHALQSTGRCLLTPWTRNHVAIFHVFDIGCHSVVATWPPNPIVKRASCSDHLCYFFRLKIDGSGKNSESASQNTKSVFADSPCTAMAIVVHTLLQILVQFSREGLHEVII